MFASVPSGVRLVITSFARRVAMVMNYQGTAAASRDGDVDNSRLGPGNKHNDLSLFLLRSCRAGHL